MLNSPVFVVVDGGHCSKTNKPVKKNKQRT